jgi:hypothetical protein
MSAGFKLKGMEDVKRIFQNLSEMDRLKFFVDEFKPVAKTLESSMKNLTPVYRGKQIVSKQYASRNHARGTLRNSIGMKIAGQMIPVVYVSLNRKRSVDAWYDHMVVGGHSYGSTKVPPNPIVEKTWDAVGGIVAGQLENRLKNKLKLMMK